jgi:hypothetical protein
MDPYRERQAAFDAWWARVRSFRQQPFPTDWAKVVAGVGLASFSMRVEHSLSWIPMLGSFKPDYLRRTGQAQSTVKDLRDLLVVFDQFLPSLPPEPRHYFEDFRSLVADALALTDTWWTTADPETAAPAE